MLKNLLKPKSPKPMTADEIAQVIERLTGANIEQLFDHAEGATLQITKGDQVLFIGEYIADDWFGQTQLKDK